MHKHSKILLSAVLAIAALAVAVSSAGASRLAVNSTDFYLIWEDGDQRLTFNPAGIQCEVTLLGSFHSTTIVKTDGLLIGHITHASVDESGCLGGTGRPYPLDLPWHVTYEGIEGTLPGITGVLLLLRPGFLIDDPDTGASCSSRGGNALGTANLGTGGAVTSLTPDQNVGLPLDDLAPSILCDLIGVGTFNGSARVDDDLADGGDIDITLVA